LSRPGRSYGSALLPFVVRYRIRGSSLLVPGGIKHDWPAADVLIASSLPFPFAHSSKFSGDSHAASADRMAGHSPSSSEKIMVSRFRPLTIMCCHSRLSRWKPKRSAARSDRAFWLSQRQSHRRSFEHHDRPITVRHVASVVRLSEYHFMRSFRPGTGLSVQRYLTQIRLRHPMALSRSVCSTRAISSTSFVPITV